MRIKYIAEKNNEGKTKLYSFSEVLDQFLAGRWIKRENSEDAYEFGDHKSDFFTRYTVQDPRPFTVPCNNSSTLKNFEWLTKKDILAKDWTIVTIASE